MAATPEDPQPLTEQEVEEREELLKSGFSNWNRRDFSAFVRACEKVHNEINLKFDEAVSCA